MVVAAVGTAPAGLREAGLGLLRAALDGPAWVSEHPAALLVPPTHLPVDRLPVRLADAVRRYARDAGVDLRLRVALAHDVPTALAVLASDALRGGRPAVVAVTERCLRSHPVARSSDHRVVRVPGLDEPVWLLADRVPDVDALFHALMAVPSLRDADGRRLVLDLLPPGLANGVEHHPNAALHVGALLHRCLEHRDGLNALLRALRVLESEDSTSMVLLTSLLQDC